MHRRSLIAVVGAVAVLALGTGMAAANGHYAGLDENDVSNEPSQPTDRNGFSTAGAVSGNGFGDTSTNEWDLVLDGYAVSDDNYPVDPNTVLSAVLANADESHHQVIYPGTVDYNAWWGWWKDKGSGLWAQETASPTAGGPDDKIDDGSDNHKSDVHFSNAAQGCPPDDPTCWQETGSWDEWILRGRGLSKWASKRSADPDDPQILEYNDQMKLFIDPGTTARTLEVALGHPEEQPGPDRPGYAVLSDTNPSAKVVDANCEAGGYEDTRGDKSAGAAWQCVAGVTTDRSLLITTEVRTAVDAPLAGQGSPEGARVISEARAVDTDVYTALSPTVDELYRTAVWDPDDEEETPVVEGSFLFPDEGPKEYVQQTYTHRFADVYAAGAAFVEEVTNPTDPARGSVEARTVDPSWPHEPNHPGDSFPGAKRGDNPADYNGNLGRDEDGDGQRTFYEPNDQSWQGYQEKEHLWADFFQYYTPLPNILLGGGFGFSAQNAASPDEQNTHVPGFLVPFARAGTWLDSSEDTWIGNAHPVEAYQDGTVDDPNAYGSDELRFVCSGAGSLSATFYPALPPRGDVNEDGEVGIEDRPWGTTSPPRGVFLYDSFGGGLTGGLLGDVVGDTPVTDDSGGRLSQHIQYGPISIGMGCSGRSTGTWFPGDAILMPSGSSTYPIVMKGKAELKDSGAERIGRGVQTAIGQETVTDVDVVNSWT